MKIISYEYTELNPRSWTIKKVYLGKLNLLVGDTASGKTRFLNTIFNLGRMVTGSGPLRGSAKWDLSFEHKGITYFWQIQTRKMPNGKVSVAQEKLTMEKGTSSKTLLSRTVSSISFLSKPLEAKLPTDVLSVSILREEPLISPIIEAFSLILRRNFQSDALNILLPVGNTNPKFFEKSPKSTNEISNIGLPTNPKLFLLSLYFPALYKQICDYFVSIFPVVSSISIKDLKEYRKGFEPPGPVPVFSIKERNIKGWISIDQLSTGMQKVLLILTDVLTLPNGSIYMIDEYENSLGISSIDFFSSFINEVENNIQFIITSHHPYLINNIPAENWLVFNRNGPDVDIRYGKKNIEFYGESKQSRFLRLINDPFYSGGNE